MVDPRGDYRPQAVDADVHLDWNNVLQILASAQSQSTSCPICLSIPVAPRMAKCGHMFCLPCLIRYMHSTDEMNPMPEKKARWKKCPICWDSIFISETRPVRWFLGQEGEAPREGRDVVLRLMTRQAGSTLALPRDGAESLPKAETIPWFYAAEVTDYARVMKGSEDYMIAHFDREIEELRRQEKEDELMFGEETQWTKKAIAIIFEAREKIKGIGNPPQTFNKPDERKSKRLPIQFNESDEQVPDFYQFQHAAKSGQSISANSGTSQVSTSTSTSTSSLPDTQVTLNSPSREIEQNSRVVSLKPTASLTRSREHDPGPNVSAKPDTALPKTSRPEYPPSGETAFFFYQALLQYYLSPLDIRILKAAFGDFASFPSTILPRVERVSTGHIVDDELRKRAKYLAHLPYGCEVGFLECDWTDTVVPDVLATFSGEVERRRKRNREKEVREEKERVRAEREEDDKRWAAVRRKRPSVSKDKVADTSYTLPAEQEDSWGTSSSADLTAASTSPPWLSSQARTGSAFASLASPSTSPVAPRTVWGTTAIVPTSPPLQPVSHEQDSTDNDGWLGGWEHDLLQEDDLLSRFQATTIGVGSSHSGASMGNVKKKKNRKITLMTTNARRGA